MREYEAGRELDALIAEKVMGREVSRWDPEWVSQRPYSTDIGAAWSVVEKLAAMELFPEIHLLNDGDWRCEVRGEQPMDVWEDAPTAPLAICRAALKALDREP